MKATAAIVIVAFIWIGLWLSNTGVLVDPEGRALTLLGVRQDARIL